MDYRDILKEHLERRKSLNPRYSLRSFAAKLEISPSKLSEVLTRKKKLSVSRLEDIARKLNLQGPEKELFLLSAEIESEGAPDAAIQIQKLSQQIRAQKTTQRNAWYFGAVQALEDLNLEAADFREALGLTNLQIENAKRYVKRIHKLHPERRDLTFEPTSLVKKVSETLVEDPTGLQADFLLLNEAQLLELTTKIKALLKKFKIEQKSRSVKNLQMVYFGAAQLLSQGE